MHNSPRTSFMDLLYPTVIELSKVRDLVQAEEATALSLHSLIRILVPILCTNKIFKDPIYGYHESRIAQWSISLFKNN